jgi:hypothetical protein
MATARRPRKPTKKQQAAAKEFIAAVEKGVVALGGRKKSAARLTGDFLRGAEYDIDTRFGPLLVVPYDDWVHTRFAEPGRAKAALMYVNPYSGKWNHHYNKGAGPSEAEYFLHQLASVVQRNNPIGATLAATKAEARRLASKGNSEGWKVVVGRVLQPDGDASYAIRFQPEPKRERLDGGVWFEPLVPYTSVRSARPNPTPSAQLRRQVKTDSLKRIVSRGGIYFGENYAGRPLSVGPYKAAGQRPRYAVFIGNTPVEVGSASDAVAHFIALAKPGSIRASGTTEAKFQPNPTCRTKPKDNPTCGCGGAYEDNPLGWRTPVRPAPGAAHVDWDSVAKIVNAHLSQVQTDIYASPSKRALKWFKRYEYPRGSAYKISRTEARRLLDHVDVDLDKIVEQAINESFGEYAVNPTKRLRFQTSDGYTLEWNGKEWSDGDMVFDGGPDGPIESGTGEPIEGVIVSGSKPCRMNPVREVPERVERYFQEAMEQGGNTEPQAWAIAWSRYCKYTEPESKHCKLRQSEYFPGRKGKGSKGAGKCVPKRIEMVLKEGPIAPDRKVLTPSSAGTNLFKRADKTLKEWAMRMPADDMWKVDFEIRFEGDRPYEGRVDLSREWARSDDLAAHVKRHLTLIAGRGAPARMTPQQYANYLHHIDPDQDAMQYAEDLLDNCDVGSSRPSLPTKLPTGSKKRSAAPRKPSKKRSTPKKRTSGRSKPKTPSRPRVKRASGDKLKGGLADAGAPIGVDAGEVAAGIAVEMEHTDDPKIAREIAYDHLTEDPNYYKKLETIEDESLGTFEKALQRFLHAAQSQAKPTYEIDIERGRRYVRVLKKDRQGGRSAYGFVDKLTGDVLKAASWKSPAKGARGNIYSGDYRVSARSVEGGPMPPVSEAPARSLVKYVIVDTRDGEVMKSVAPNRDEAFEEERKLNAREADKTRFRAQWPVDEKRALAKPVERGSSKKASPKKATPKRASKKASPKKATPKRASSSPWERLAMNAIGQSVENDKWRAHRYAYHLNLIDLQNAGKRGKKVVEFMVDNPSVPLARELLRAAEKGVTAAEMRKLAPKPQTSERQLRGVDVRKPGMKVIHAVGKGVVVHATPQSFSADADDINQMRMMPPMNARKTAIKKFYEWAKANERKIQSMTWSDLTKALQKAGIEYHSYCGMD